MGPDPWCKLELVRESLLIGITSFELVNNGSSTAATLWAAAVTLGCGRLTSPRVAVQL